MKFKSPLEDWKPRLAVDRQTQLAFEALAQPYFGRPKAGSLGRKIASILRSKFPGHTIDVQDCNDSVSRAAGVLQFLCVSDGMPDFGLVFMKAGPDGSAYGQPANDH